MLRAVRPLLAADAGKYQTLFNVLTGKQALKDQVPVKDCNLTAIFGPTWKADLTKWVESETDATKKAAAKKDLDTYLKRIELTRYTRDELTTHGILAAGPGRVTERAEKFLLEAGKARLAELKAGLGENGTAAFRQEVEEEAKLANWPPAKAHSLADRVIAAAATA